MNPLHERYSDLVDEQDDSALLACVADLDTTCAAFTLPRERDHALARSLASRAANPSGNAAPSLRSRRAWRAAPLHVARWRLTSFALAVLVAGSGIGVYLHAQTPVAVDAQTVLHRAAAFTPGPDQATRATYKLTADGGLKGTADIWVGFDHSGAPSQFALSETMFRNGTLAPGLSARISAAGTTLLHAYGVEAGPAKAGPAEAPGQALEGILVGTLLAQKLSQQPSAYGLRQESLDGVSVFALTPNASTGQTYYFNADSYVLEGADWTQNGTQWQARLDPATYQTMNLSAVPPHTFPATVDGQTTDSAMMGSATGSGPTTTRSVQGGGVQVVGDGGGVHVSMSSGGPQGSGSTLTVSVSLDGQNGPDVDITPALVSACKTTVQAFAGASLAGNESMLAMCQGTNPDMSADGLVAALMAPIQSALDASVASDAIAADQETTQLAAIREAGLDPRKENGS